MLDNDLIITFLFMALLFLRQVSILKQPNKIDYAPLMLGIGAISSVVHFIIHPEITNVVLVLRESLLPLLVAFFFFLVMNILHQTRKTQDARNKDEFSHALVSEMTELKKFMADLEARMSASQQEDMKIQQSVREKFQKDIQALNEIKTNQDMFIGKFKETEDWHKSVSRDFEEFKNIQLPGLDDVVHKHIDILRVAEQEHYNELRATLENAVNSRCNIAEDIEKLKASLNNMNSLSNNIANTITNDTLEQLSGVTKAFENQVITLKSHTESVSTSLLEGENKLNTIREQSELIINQMVLSSKKMSELERQNHGLHDIYSIVNELMKDMERIKSDYVKSQSQLSVIAGEMRSSENEQIESLRKQINSLADALTNKIDTSLDKLHKHYHIAGEDITQSVQILAKKAQLQKGYSS